MKSLVLDVYLFYEISLCPNFSIGSFCWRVFILLHAFVNLHMWLILIRVWSLICWVWRTNFTLVKFSSITSVSYFQWSFYLICLVFYCLVIIYEFSIYSNMVYAFVWSKWVTFICICSLKILKTLFMLVLFMMWWYLIRASADLKYSMDLKLRSYDNL